MKKNSNNKTIDEHMIKFLVLMFIIIIVLAIIIQLTGFFGLNTSKKYINEQEINKEITSTTSDITKDSSTNRIIPNAVEQDTNQKSNETIANEVILGLWGNGYIRKLKLSEAGYDYHIIQEIVNQKLK